MKPELTENQYLIKHYQRFLSFDYKSTIYNKVQSKIETVAFRLLDELFEYPGARYLVREDIEGLGEAEIIARIRNCKVHANSRTVDFVKNDDDCPYSVLTIDLEVPLYIQVKYNVIQELKNQ